PALLRRRGDVEKADLIGAVPVVGPRLLDRIAGLPEIAEPDPLHDPASANVEAGDHASRPHAPPPRPASSTKFERTLWPISPPFSGWNCTPHVPPVRTADAKTGGHDVEATLPA